jgi:hypothetical protein
VAPQTRREPAASHQYRHYLRRESGLIEHDLQSLDPGCRLAVWFAEHGLLLVDEHVLHHRTVSNTSDRRETEEGTVAEVCRELGLATHRVAEEQYV